MTLRESDNVKIMTLICGTAILAMLLYTDGVVAAGIATAAAAGCFGLGTYLGKK
jgi:hypothetical protein